MMMWMDFHRSPWDDEIIVFSRGISVKRDRL
jgi:hypothetical protein